MSPAAPANHKGGVWLQALADIVKTSDGGFISGDRLGMQLALVPGCPSLKLIAKAHGGYLSMNKVLSRLLGVGIVCEEGMQPEFVFFSSVLDRIACIHSTRSRGASRGCNNVGGVFRQHI
jgi:hypothetical protein